jgi:hypothetical protein
MSAVCCTISFFERFDDTAFSGCYPYLGTEDLLPGNVFGHLFKILADELICRCFTEAFDPQFIPPGEFKNVDKDRVRIIIQRYDVLSSGVETSDIISIPKKYIQTAKYLL